jgi:hypothetical protein
MTEERADPPVYSEADISEVLDDLIDAMHEVENKRRFVKEYRNTHRPPVVPQSRLFEDAASLTEHKNAHTKYIQGLEDAMAEQTRSEERFEAQGAKIKDILPRDTHVIHSYTLRSSAQAARLGRYRITHTYPAGKIDVVRADTNGLEVRD